MLSPPKPFDEIQPNLMCELLTLMGHATAKSFCPAPWGSGEGSKGQISLNFNYKVNFEDFYTKLCVCYKTYQKGFSFCRLGHAPGVGFWGAGVPKGSKIYFFFKQGHVPGISNRHG